MEIELSWQSWLQKILCKLFGILLIISLSCEVFVPSMLPPSANNSKNLSTFFPYPTVEWANNRGKGTGGSNPVRSSVLHSLPYLDKDKEVLPRGTIRYVGDSSSHDDNTFQESNGANRRLLDNESNLVNEGTENLTLGITASTESEFVQQYVDLSIDNRFHEDASTMLLTYNDDYDGFQDDFESTIFNESFWSNLDCEDFESLPQPPNFIEFLPPPPIPPFLGEEEEIIFNKETLDYKYKKNGNAILFDNQFCYLCNWAKENGTASDRLIPKKQETKDEGLNNIIIGTVVGVALLSAGLGGMIMGTLLKCRKKEALTSEGKRAICPLSLKSCWINSSIGKNCQAARSSISGDRNETSSRPRPGFNRGIPLIFWKRSSSQTPLESFPDSDNVYYSDDQYAMAETSSSVVYAELASNNISNQTCASLDHHHYSEIDDIYRLSSMMPATPLNNGVDNAYEKFGYILPPMSSPIAHEGSLYSGNVSAPSSAYYSDLSSCEIYVVDRNTFGKCRNKRKRKLRLQNSERIYPFSRESLSHNFPVTSRSRSNLAASKATNFPVTSRSNLAASNPTNFSSGLQARSRHHHYLPSSETLRGIADKSNAASQKVPSLQQRELPLTHTSNRADTLPITVCSHKYPNHVCHLDNIAASSLLAGNTTLQSVNSDNNSLLHLYELHSLQSMNSNVRRSLPPLPGRKIAYPYKRNLRSNISTVPSEYI